MKLLFLLIQLGLMSSCAQSSYAPDTNSSAAPQTALPACQEWEQRFAELTPDKQRALANENVVAAGHGWLISRTIESDCQLNLRIGTYFAKRVYQPDKESEGDRQFASAHSRQIVETLRKLWPTLDAERSSLRDGAFSEEKFNLFDDAALAEKDLAPLISDLIEQGSMSREFAATLVPRPMLGVKPAILKDLERAETRGDVPEQIYCLVVLQRMHDPNALPKLRGLSEKKNLSTVERKLIPVLLAKIRRGEELEFADIENLDYENDQASQ